MSEITASDAMSELLCELVAGFSLITYSRAQQCIEVPGYSPPKAYADFGGL